MLRVSKYEFLYLFAKRERVFFIVPYEQIQEKN